MKYLLKLTYCGTRYCGFQVQNNANTVQAELMRAAEKIFTVPCLITGCSRTDSGVHALEYLATLEPVGIGARIPVERIPKALAHALPPDISVMEAVEVSDDFSVRRAVKGKEYMYLLWTKEYMDPFLCDRAWHYSRPLDVEKMNLAAKAIVGKHDFASFMASGSDIIDTVRTISRCEVEACGDGSVRIYVAADGFLYNMVRIIVGTLVYVSEGKISPCEIENILNAKDRTRAGKTAPADGLYLKKVFI
jgi:tRNA pseudouridine38-40 synthase